MNRERVWETAFITLLLTMALVTTVLVLLKDGTLVQVTHYACEYTVAPLGQEPLRPVCYERKTNVMLKSDLAPYIAPSNISLKNLSSPVYD